MSKTKEFFINLDNTNDEGYDYTNSVAIDEVSIIGSIVAQQAKLNKFKCIALLENVIEGLEVKIMFLKTVLEGLKEHNGNN